MGKYYFESGDEKYIVANDNTTVIGTGDPDEQIILAPGVDGVKADSTIERVDFVGNIGDFKFQQGFGSNLNVLDGSGNVIVSIASVDGKTLAFGDGSVELHYNDDEHTVSVGGAVISTEVQSIDPETIVINTEDVSEADQDQEPTTPGTPGETFTLSEAVTAEELPEVYTLTDASIDLGTLSVAQAKEQLAELQTIINGAANADELILDADYTIADVIGALSTDIFSEMQIIADATQVNVLDDATIQQIVDFNANYDNLGGYPLGDTRANLLDEANSGIVNGALGIFVTEPLTVDEYTAFDAEFEHDFGYTLADTLDNLAAAAVGVVEGAEAYSLADPADAFEDLPVADALNDAELSLLEGASNSDDYAYTLNDTLENFMGAEEGVVDAADSYTIDPATPYVAGEKTVAEVNADYTEASNLIAGAENTADLTLADLFTYSLADTFENLVAAEDSLIDDAAAYSLTDPAGTNLGELTGDEYAVVDGATNTENYTFTVEPADILSITPASSTVVEGEAITFEVALSHAVNVDRELDYKLEGVETAAAAAADPLTDLGQITGKVTVAAGETTATITLTPGVDVTEGLEAFSVNVLDENFAVAQSTDPITIQDAPNSGQAFTLTTGVDEFTGGAGNDTFTGVVSDTAESNTWSALDDLDGGDGEDSLKLSDVSSTTTPKGIDLSIGTITDIETLTIQSVNDVESDPTTHAALDTTDVTGLKTLNVTKGKDVYVEAADTTDVNVSGASGGDGGTGSGLISVDGGKNVVVTDAAYENDITIGAATAPAGTIDVTDTDQGAGAITIDGGTDVTITAESDNETAGGAVTVGATTQATGAVQVTSNHTGDGTVAVNQGDITVTGGTSVTVESNIDITAKDETVFNTHTFGDVAVTGDGNTTTVTVTQDYAETEFTKAGTDEVPATETLTFKEMTTGQTTTVNGLTFTAGDNLSASEVAQAFANLTVDDTQADGGPVANGFYSGTFNRVSGWTSGAADGATVTFTAPATVTSGLVINAGDVDPTSGGFNAGTAEVAEDTSTNDVTYGDVAINDDATAAAITAITLDGYGSLDLGTGVSGSLDALTTLNLANSGGSAVLKTAATSLDLNVDNVNDWVSLDGGTATIATLNLTATGADSAFDLTAAALETFTVDAQAELDLSTGSTLGAATGTLKTVDINGTAAVNLGDIKAQKTLNTFSATDNTGGVAAVVETDAGTLTGTLEEYIFSQGDDVVTVNAATGTTVDVKVTLGTGNDTLDLSTDIINALGAVADGGADTDTLVMRAADAATASGDTTFEGKMQGFEVLQLRDAAAQETVDLANMDDINQVIVGAATGVEQVDTITITDPDTSHPIEEGDVFTVTINGTTFSHTVETGGQTENDISLALVALINADNNLDVTAADGTSNLTLTSDYAGIGFTTAVANPTDTGDNDTIAVTTAPANAAGLTLDNYGADGTLIMTVGNAGNAMDINLADATGGTDIFNVVLAAGSFAGVNYGALDLSGIETVNISAPVDDSAILHLYADKATTVNATEGNADGTLTLTLDNRTDQLATLDASTLEGGLVNNATVADLVVKGGLGADELTAAADDVTLYGNDGDDTLIVESGLRVDLYGGEGADTFAIHSGASTSLDAYTVINGVDSGDVIAMTGADAFSSTEIALSVGADESLLNYANQAVATVDEGGMGWFERGGNTYIVQDVTSSTGTNSDDFTAGEDMIIMITGVVDLSTASFNATGGTLEMA